MAEGSDLRAQASPSAFGSASSIRFAEARAGQAIELDLLQLALELGAQVRTLGGEQATL